MTVSDCVSDVPEDVVASIVKDINEKGFGVLPNYVSAADLGTMRNFVRGALVSTGGKYASFKGPEAVAGSGLDLVAKSSEFRALMKRIYELGTGKSAPDTSFYQLLRCLSGHDAQLHSMRFHYDTYVLTALVPVEIPTSNLKGDLLVIPNSRKVRNSYFANMLDKILLDNNITQSLLKRYARSSAARIVRIGLTPGNLYFFWGYRSIHTNEACGPQDVRATALFHFVDPHADSTMKRWLGR